MEPEQRCDSNKIEAKTESGCPFASKEKNVSILMMLLQCIDVMREF